MVLEFGIQQSLAAPNYHPRTEVRHRGLSVMCIILLKIHSRIALTLVALLLQDGASALYW